MGLDGKTGQGTFLLKVKFFVRKAVERKVAVYFVLFGTYMSRPFWNSVLTSVAKMLYKSRLRNGMSGLFPGVFQLPN